ncbi:MAG: MFS transporter [Caulobacterales bacterium]|nr:MFS transporter [Caulobacterales bacterium]
MQSASTGGERPKLGPVTTGLYGVGAVSSGIELRALGSFLLIFYNQAIGMSPISVSLAITLVMIVDAIMDPLVGFFSDHFRSRWGRRHPFMYASALPLAVSFFLLWNPPLGWSEDALFWYLLLCLMAIRICDTLFELPSVALGPDLVAGYDARTNIVSARIFFRTAAAMAVSVGGLQFFLAPNADGSGGVTSRDGYFLFSLVMSAVMFVVIIVSAMATHRFIPWLRQPAPKVYGSSVSPMQFLRDFLGVLGNRAALAMIAVGVFVSVASASRNGLELYLGLYFWGLTQAQLSLLAMLTAAGALIGASFVPFVSRWLGKRRGAITTYSIGLVNSIGPIVLRLLGLMPENGSDLLFAILVVEFFLQGLFYVMTAVMMNSMLADVVEDVAVRTGQRSEGIIFSADQFFTKAVSGLGVLVSGVMLSIINFPSAATRENVTSEMVWSLGALYAPLMVAVTCVAIGLLMLYPIDRARHEDNIRALGQQPDS